VLNWHLLLSWFGGPLCPEKSSGWTIEALFWGKYQHLCFQAFWKTILFQMFLDKCKNFRGLQTRIHFSFTFCHPTLLILKCGVCFSASYPPWLYIERCWMHLGQCMLNSYASGSKKGPEIGKEKPHYCALTPHSRTYKPFILQH
jgi:hypothetical protein